MGEKGLIPEMRFKGFQEEWKELKLDVIAETYSGGTPLVSNRSYYNGNIPFIRSGEIYNKSTKYYITNEAIQNSSARMIKRGDLLYALYGATSGEVSISQINGAINQAILAIVLRNEYNPYYLLQWLRIKKEKIVATQLQGGQGNLSGEIIRNLILTLPSFEEQQKIGEFFKVLDERIANQERKIAKVKSLKEAYLTEMFPQEGETVPKRRFKEFEGKWLGKSLGEITKINTGDSDVKDAVENGKYPFYIRSKNIVKSDIYTYDGEAILIPGEGRLGEVYHYYNGKFNYHQRVYKVSNFNNDINGRFVYYSMILNFKKHALRETVKATVDSLRLPTITSYRILLPSYEEQQKIGAFFKNIDNQIKAEELKLEKLKKMKEAYLEEMFV